MGRQFEIHVTETKSGWLARCYDEDTAKHVWSSESAPTIQVALKEIAQGIEREVHSHESMTIRGGDSWERHGDYDG